MGDVHAECLHVDNHNAIVRERNNQIGRLERQVESMRPALERIKAFAHAMAPGVAVVIATRAPEGREPLFGEDLDPAPETRGEDKRSGLVHRDVYNQAVADLAASKAEVERLTRVYEPEKAYPEQLGGMPVAVSKPGDRLLQEVDTLTEALAASKAEVERLREQTSHDCASCPTCEMNFDIAVARLKKKAEQQGRAQAFEEAARVVSAAASRHADCPSWGRGTAGTMAEERERACLAVLDEIQALADPAAKATGDDDG